MLHGVDIISVTHTDPCSMLLAMLAMAKEMHGFLYLWMHVVLLLYGYGALLGGPLSCQSSAIECAKYRIAL